MPSATSALLEYAYADTLDEHTRARGHRHLAHLSTERIEDAIRRAGGNLTAAAEKLGVGRSTLYTRITEEPSLLATRDEIVESFVDEAETAIVAAVRRGDVNAATFVLRTQGSRRGWSTWAARHEAEQRPEPPPRRRVDVTAALRALSPEELLQLEAIVTKLEGSAKSEARDREAGYGVAASGEVEPTAEADMYPRYKSNPDDPG
jgi:hypothetical protein